MWVLFTTADGSYLKMPDGSPEFNNIHPLVYGLGQQRYPLPRIVEETYTLYVPPRQWGAPLRIRMAVAVGGRLLRCGTGHGHWVDLGELPPAPPAAP